MPALAYDRTGAGDPVVLLHGVGHHRQAWRPVVEALDGELDVVACDLPGFGRSEPLPAGVVPNVGNYADAVERFVAGLGLERPHVAGNSMGGAIALELAGRGAARSATAFSPAGFWSPAERRYSRGSLALVYRIPRLVRPAVTALAGIRVARALLFAQLAARPARIPADEARASLRALWASPVFLDALRAFDGYDCRPPDRPGVPVTVAWGARDRLLLARPQARRAREALGTCRSTTIPRRSRR
jgi:pimeloyl-ACP methyl ester carboxylesterase